MRAYVLTLMLIMMLPAPARSSSVMQVNFDDLVGSSEFIFEGRVLSAAAEMDSGGRIHTLVTFEVLDILKGTYSGRTVVLRYLGGKAGGLELKIPDLTPPDMGEKGIYFVESLARPPVHPLYGWDQGHFLLLTNSVDRTERVFSRTRKPIIGFQNSPGKGTGLSTGVALGLFVADDTRSANAVSVSDFKNKIQQFLAQR